MSNKYIKVNGTDLVRNYESCPKCGPGFFLAIHSNRKTCGRCGYTQFDKKGKKTKKAKNDK